MSFETKRGYNVRVVGKEVIITCPSIREAQKVFNSLHIQVLMNKLSGMGKIKKVKPLRA